MLYSMPWLTHCRVDVRALKASLIAQRRNMAIDHRREAVLIFVFSRLIASRFRIDWGSVCRSSKSYFRWSQSRIRLGF